MIQLGGFGPQDPSVCPKPPEVLLHPYIEELPFSNKKPQGTRTTLRCSCKDWTSSGKKDEWIQIFRRINPEDPLWVVFLRPSESFCEMNQERELCRNRPIEKLS